MCESCSGEIGRRTFLTASGALGAAGLLSTALADETSRPAEEPLQPRKKEPARVRVAFLYPPAEVVNAGKLEDSWHPHHWFTWPGNQFEPERQEQVFTRKIQEMAAELGVMVELTPQPIYQEARVKEFIARAKSDRPDAVLIVNFWNTFSKWSYQMATESAPTAIVYQPLGSSHQLPPESLRKAKGIYYIHSIENWPEIERGLRAVRARKMLAQSRLLRVSGATPTPARATEPQLGVEILHAPAAELNGLFDAVKADDELTRQAMKFKGGAQRVMDVTDEYFVDAMRAHRAVGQIIHRYGADAVTIECLQLKHRKPCISFALRNGELFPCGCENDLNATLTLMLGRWLFDRPGFQHNPDFDTSENMYFGSHCTCALTLHGPKEAAQPYLVRPFFHQLPKTAALDVQWKPGEPIVVAKYLSGKETLHAWTGRVIESPTSPPVGGCATRVLLDIDGVDDVCRIYSGPHPILFCATSGEARRLKAFARMSQLQMEGNV